MKETETGYIKLASQHQIGDRVSMSFTGIPIDNCYVIAVKFTESKVLYDIQVGTGGTDYTVIREVESDYVIKNQ